MHDRVLIGSEDRARSTTNKLKVRYVSRTLPGWFDGDLVSANPEVSDGTYYRLGAPHSQWMWPNVENLS
jgi:hypothetical protein